MQHREKSVLEFWDRKNHLNISNKEYRNFLEKFFYFFLNEDIKGNDITTNSIIKKNKKISAVIVAKEDGIFAGLDEFRLLNTDLNLKFFKNDGDEIKTGDILIEMKGNAKKILSRERFFLNLLQRMGGIATVTNLLNKKLKSRIKIAATRKTLWSMMDKKAVSIGNGLTHRLNLNDGILIKDNHLKILDGDIEKALNLANNKSKYIEIEVENKEQALKAANYVKKTISKKISFGRNFFAIMFDKIPPKEIKSIIQEIKNMNLHGQILFEASGNINVENILEYANCGVDIISMGCLTNPGKSLNMSLEILK